MLCQRCQQKAANVHITEIINGKKHETHLCQGCAQELKIKLSVPQLPIQNFTNLFGFLNQTNLNNYPEKENYCPNCLTPYSRIGESGYVGCSECYKYFNSRLEPLLRKIHGANRHCGKIPKRLRGVYAVKREMEELKRKLKAEVDKENYEAAAHIRDEIKALGEKTSRGDEQ